MLKKIKRTTENGQALLFVVVAVTIALAVGISVSTRSLNSSKRVARSDTAARVVAAAEGGIERLLLQPASFLNDLDTNPNPDCSGVGVSYAGGMCEIDFPPSTGDKITAMAIVDASMFRLNETDNYWFNLDPGYVKEINLSDYPSGTAYTANTIDICWDKANSAIYYYSYDSIGNIKRGGFIANGFSNSGKVASFTTVNSGREGYEGCGTVNLLANAYGLRIKTLYSSTKVSVFPSGSVDAFPYQGFKIISKGILKNVGDNSIVDTKIITAYVSFPYASSTMDYGLYTQDVLN